MATSSLDRNTESPKQPSTDKPSEKTISEQPAPEQQEDYDRKETLPKNHYFDNETVERLMHTYVRGSCVEVLLRDEIMTHASELIRQIIKAHNLGQIYPGKDDSSIMDLFQTAWIQIESALYKYEARPHCSICYNNLRPNDSSLSEEYIFEDEVVKRIKICPNCGVRIIRASIYYRGKSRVFNMWSQVARTVILAYIKKDRRDHKNSDVFKSHIEGRVIGQNCALDRFFTEAREISKYNDDHLKILDAIRQLYMEDERPHEGLISKLVIKTGFSRTCITNFLKMVRLRSHELTDSPVNEEINTVKMRIDEIGNNVDGGNSR